MKSRVSKHLKNHDAEGNQNLNSKQSQAWLPKKEGNGNIHNGKTIKDSNENIWIKIVMLSEKQMMVISSRISIKFKKPT